ncbi:TolC family protein, partial [Burkholderia ubonensis]|uniref:TolC family protein n=1 Tax=Burkholderia ubonensis TaxID=101571 RepID=UPI001E40B1F5
MVSALCLAASSLPMMESAYADNVLIMRSHRSVTDWARQGAAVPDSIAKPAVVAVELKPGDAASAEAPARLARAVREDETARRVRIGGASGQAQPAEVAKADEDRRRGGAANAVGGAKNVEIAKAKEAKRIADEARAAEVWVAEMKRVEEAAQAAKAKRAAKAAQAAETRRTAEAARAAEAQRMAQAARAAETKHAQRDDDGESLIVFRPVEPAEIQPAKPAVPSAAAPTLARAWNPAPGRVWSASEFARPPTPRPAPESHPASSLAGTLPTAPRAPADPMRVGALTSGDVPPPSYAPPTKRKAVGKQSAGTFAQWLETQPDSFGNGPVPSEAEVRRIFNAAVKAAADRSPQVRQAHAEYLAANADVDEAKGQRWPQVDIGTQSPGMQFGPGAGNGSSPGSAVSMNITTTLFDWGRTSKTIGSRKHLADAAHQKYQAELERSAYEVSKTLIELGKQRIVVELSQKFVDRMETLVKMLSEIVEVDRGRGSELTQAKTRLLQAQALRDSADAKVRDSELTLAKLVGENAVMIPHTREWQLERGNLGRLLAEVTDHPGIRQAQAEADAADLHAKAVRASGLPQVNWVVNASTGRDSLGRRQPWQTMVTLNWGAFRGGSTSAAAAAAGQRATANWQKVELQRRDLGYAIRTADQDAQTLLERANLYRGLSAETDRVRKAFFEQWYHLGRRTLLDVLIAENDHYGNQVSEVSNRFDSYEAVFREYASAGVLARWLDTGA